MQMVHQSNMILVFHSVYWFLVFAVVLSVNYPLETEQWPLLPFFVVFVSLDILIYRQDGWTDLGKNNASVI